MLKTILEGELDVKKEQEVDRDANGKITYQIGQDTPCMSAPSRRGRESAGHSLLLTFVPKMAHDDGDFKKNGMKIKHNL